MSHMTRTNQDIPTDYDGRYFAGDSAVLDVTIENDDGSPKDISGADVAFALSEYEGHDPIITKDTTDGIRIVDVENGRIKVTIESSDTEDLGDADGTDYHYEIVVRDSGGKVATVTTGTWTIYEDTAILP